jgi:hypothetical protein
VSASPEAEAPEVVEALIDDGFEGGTSEVGVRPCHPQRGVTSRLRLWDCAWSAQATGQGLEAMESSGSQPPPNEPQQQQQQQQQQEPEEDEDEVVVLDDSDEETAAPAEGEIGGAVGSAGFEDEEEEGDEEEDPEAEEAIEPNLPLRKRRQPEGALPEGRHWQHPGDGEEEGEEEEEEEYYEEGDDDAEHDGEVDDGEYEDEQYYEDDGEDDEGAYEEEAEEGPASGPHAGEYDDEFTPRNRKRSRATEEQVERVVLPVSLVQVLRGRLSLFSVKLMICRQEGSPQMPMSTTRRMARKEIGIITARITARRMTESMMMVMARGAKKRGRMIFKKEMDLKTPRRAAAESKRLGGTPVGVRRATPGSSPTAWRTTRGTRISKAMRGRRTRRRSGWKGGAVKQDAPVPCRRIRTIKADR